MTKKEGARSSVKALLIMVCLFALPVVSLLFFKLGLDSHKVLMGELKFYKDSIKLADFELRAQSNRLLLSKEETDGKVLIASFFESPCQGDCLKMLTELKRVQAEFDEKDAKKIVFFSITTNPEKDSVGVLADLVAQNQIDTTNWKFLNGSESTIHSFIKDGCRLDKTQAKAKFVLFDARGVLCNHYDLTKVESVNRMMIHASMLLPGVERKHLEYRKEEDLYKDKEN